MGRTARTFRDALDIEENRWEEFRRTLRASQRELFDRVFEDARQHADAGSMIVTPRIMEVVLVAALMELTAKIEKLDARLWRLEQRYEELTRR
ncbi:hypothetical protein EU538_11405 [Candidatus Thorarchaeota archaeon]|jgi:hypothetical protein|nr:MAG: hypothetical protein EU538_11405 [Candidatus Thorarchaeota archaeon]